MGNESQAFTDVIVPFYIDNGLGLTSSGSEAVSGYTLEIAKFTFTPDVSALIGTGLGASHDKIIWDFGDGTHEYGYSVTKHYKYPGVYTATCKFLDQYGNPHDNVFKQDITVYNYIPDELVWYTPLIEVGLPEVAKAGAASNDLTIYRYNSWQSWPSVSADGGYYINLYSQGSKSKPLTKRQYYQERSSHLIPTWRFLKSKDSKVPLERTQTEFNDFIYLKKDGSNIVRAKENDPGSIFAGTTGYDTVNYIDDTPNKVTSKRDPNARDIILYASFDTSKFPVSIEDDNLSQFEILQSSYFQLYETKKIGLPMMVKYNPPSGLMITSNGLAEFDINKNKFFESPIAFNVSVMDIDGNKISHDLLPPLLPSRSAGSWAYSGADTTTDTLTAPGLVTCYLSAHDSIFQNVTSVTGQEDFEVWDNGTINAYPDDKWIRIVTTNNKTVHLLTSQLSLSSYYQLINTSASDLSQNNHQWSAKNGNFYTGTVNSGASGTGGRLYTEYIDNDSIPIVTYGTYSGYLSTRELWNDDLHYRNNRRIYATTMVDAPVYFNHDVLYYYACNPTNDFFYQIKPTYYRQYSYGTDGFTQTYTPPLTTQSPGNSGLMGFAVDYLGQAIMVDGDTDRILRYDRDREKVADVQIHTLLPDVSANHYPGNLDEYGYSPSSVSLDGNNDYWVTLYDTVSTIKLDGETNTIKAVAVPPVENYLINPTTRERVDGVTGEYGENLIVPSVVDTCKNNHIIVTYTNSLCSFIARYDSSGNFLYKYGFDNYDRYFSGELCIDVSDHVWAVTKGTGLHPDGSVDESPPGGIIYSLDEQLNFRLAVSSLEGTEFTDLAKPSLNQSVTGEWYFGIVPSGTYNDAMSSNDAGASVDIGPYGYDERWFVSTLGFAQPAPKLTLTEGNTYIFRNTEFETGRRPMGFKYIHESNANTPLSANPVLSFTTSTSAYTDNVTGIGTETLTITITDNTPDRLMLVDTHNSDNRLLLEIQKYDTTYYRDASTFGQITEPNFVVPDNTNNIWFSWGQNYCSKYDVNKERVTTTIAVGSAFYDPRYDVEVPATYYTRDQGGKRNAIEGLAMDTADQLIILNNADKVLYAVDSQTPTTSAFVELATYQIPYSEFSWVESISNHDPDTDEYGFRYAHGTQHENGLDTGFESEIRAQGDWTGYRWINKYDDRAVSSDATTGFTALTGESAEFNLLPKRGEYDIVKEGEDIVLSEVIRSYASQRNLKEAHRFYHWFLNEVFGGFKDDPEVLGTVIYEKIENFLGNHNDIDTCTIKALESLAAMIDHKMEEYSVKMPHKLRRVMDLLSVKRSRLWGTHSKHQHDFDKNEQWSNPNIGPNLGKQISFIFDYDSDHGYAQGDIAKHGGNYFEAIDTNHGSPPPYSATPYLSSDVGQSNSTWKWWPDGLVKDYHINDIIRLYGNKDTEWHWNHYNSQVSTAQLTQEYTVNTEMKFVLREHFDNQFRLITPMMINYPEKLNISVSVASGASEEYYTLSDPMNRNAAEQISTIDYDILQALGLSTYAGQFTVIGDSTSNPTMSLIRNRTYTLSVSAPGHPFQITTQPGSGTDYQLAGSVIGQGTEVGDVIFTTGTDVPDTLYYQCKNHPGMHGTINLIEPEGIEHYSTAFQGITSYNLNLSVSSHEFLDKLGWGMSFPAKDNPWRYFSIYEYIPDGVKYNQPVGNLINFKSKDNTLEYSSVEGWAGDDGSMDIIIEKKLREGLGLFSPELETYQKTEYVKDKQLLENLDDPSGKTSSNINTTGGTY